MKKKWEPGVKIGSETDVEQTKKGPEREREERKREKGVQRTIEMERNLVFEKNAAQARRYFSTFLFRLGFFFLLILFYPLPS